MTDAVSARIALAYLATLSADLRAALVLDPAGEVLAGDEGLKGLALSMLDGVPTAEARQIPHGDGRLFAARSPVHLLALAMGPQALEAVVVHDLLATLDDLDGC